HDVVLALHADPALGLRLGHGAGLEELVEGDDLGLDEAALEVGVDDAGGLRSGRALGDGPGTGLLGAGGKVGLQARVSKPTRASWLRPDSSWPVDSSISAASSSSSSMSSDSNFASRKI